MVGRGGGLVKTLGGFRKAHHTVPDAVNAATNAFLGKLCAGDLAEEGEKFFQATKAALGYKRAQLTLEVASPTAVLTAKDVGDALKLGERFISTRTTALAFRLTVEDGKASFWLEERADFGPARDALVLALLIGLSTIGQALSGRELEGRIEVALPRPPWLERFADNARLDRVAFEKPAHRIVFDASLLTTPFQLADAGARELAAAQCEKELAALGFSGRLSARVRELVLSGGAVVDVEGVAKVLSMSSRTLKRRLAGEGTSYSELLEAERRARAENLLGHSAMSVKEISAALGYADTAAFSHAFQRWTGKSPSDVR